MNKMHQSEGTYRDRAKERRLAESGTEESSSLQHEDEDVEVAGISLLPVTEPFKGLDFSLLKKTKDILAVQALHETKGNNNESSLKSITCISILGQSLNKLLFQEKKKLNTKVEKKLFDRFAYGFDLDEHNVTSDIPLVITRSKYVSHTQLLSFDVRLIVCRMYVKEMKL
jgi:hypothetical protein